MKELIVASNPAKRRRRGASAKQRAAARRNIKKAQAALRRGGSAPRRRRRGSYRRATNPRRRRGAMRRIARRRNPIGGGGRSLKALLNPKGLLDRQVMPALIGGAGAVGNDIAFGLLPLPESMRTGPMRFVGKAASAVLLGYVASMVLGRKLGDQLGAGALTVVGYNVVKEVITKAAPDFAAKNLGMYLEPGLGYPGAGWSPKWGGINNTMSRLNALLPRTTGGGRPGVPGEGVAIPRQLMQPSPYAAQVNYADELDS